MERKIAVVGLGYVGLPVAVAFAKRFPGTVGFDINKTRVEALARGVDVTREVEAAELRNCGLKVTSSAEDLVGSDFFVVAVPTPIDEDKRPDLRAMMGASETVGKAIRKGAIVVYESTVYPGVTEEVCGPILERVSGLTRGKDFFLGYSPERINPGDREHRLETIVKVVSGEDARTLEIVSEVYGSIIKAGVHRAPSIRVAEAAKVIENTQRDLNIALMNELALIFDRMSISSYDVFEAAQTKWNFLRFAPGLVGGHCIGVDPYYLTTKAEQLGYRPQVILAGRRINDAMGQFIAQRTVKLLVNAGCSVHNARVGILGVTFKENISDIRNSRVPSIVQELKEFKINPLIHDPEADKAEVEEEYGIHLNSLSEFRDLDALILAVSHRAYTELTTEQLCAPIRKGGVFVDVKNLLHGVTTRDDLTYWAL